MKYFHYENVPSGVVLQFRENDMWLKYTQRKGGLTFHNGNTLLKGVFKLRWENNLNDELREEREKTLLQYKFKD